MSWLGNLIGFKGLEGKNFLKDIAHKPTRLLTGIDPWSTKIWNKALGTNDKPLVDQWGGATEQRFKDAEAKGIDTKAGRTTEGIAHAIAAYYAGGALGKAAGAAGGTAGGATEAGTSITALTPDAVYAGGVPAANAAAAGITPGAIASAGGGLGVASGAAATGGGTIGGTGTIGQGGAFTAVDGASLPAAEGVAPMTTEGAMPNVGSESMWQKLAKQGMSNTGGGGQNQGQAAPYEDINDHGGINTARESLIKKYNSNEGNMNDGYKIEVRGGDAVLIDRDGNEIGKAPANEELFSSIQNMSQE